MIFKNSIIILFIFLLLCSIGLYLRIEVYKTPTKGEKIGVYERPNTALLVIDVQEDFTGKNAKAPFPYKNSESFIDTINKIVDTAFKKQMLVIYIRQEFENSLIDLPLSKGRVISGQPGSQIDPRVKIVSQNIFVKKKSDSFSNPELEKFLIKNQINQIYVIGLDASACVYKTSKGALNRNYRVTVIQDGIMTMDMDKMNGILNKYRNDNISIINSSDFESFQ